MTPAEDEQLRIERYEWRRMKMAIMADRDNWRAYALALQELHDSGGAIMEPGLARQVDELREMCE